MKDATNIELNGEHCQENNNAEKSTRELVTQVVDSSVSRYVDGGYGWLIVLSCFLQTMIMDGSINAFGVIYLEVTEKFGASSSEAAWILSLQTCMRGLVGPLVIALKEFLGCRIVTIAGSLLIALGMFSSAFASSIAHLYVTFGVIAGIGFGVYQQIGMALVNHFFDERRGLANGIATSGTGVGLVVFPSLTNYLFSEYGFSGTCMFLAGIALQGVIAGALIITPEAALKLQMKRTQSQDKQGVDNKTFPLSDNNDEEKIDANAKETANDLKEPEETVPATKISTDKLQRKTFCQTLTAAFNLALFKDYRYVFFNLTHSIFSSCVIISPAFMPARAVSYGISKSNGSLLISIMGLSSLLTRPAMGFIVDVQPIKAKRFYMFFASALLAGSFTLVSFGPSLTAQIFYASLYGITTGSYISMLTMTLGDLIGVQSLMSGFGMVSLSVIVPTLLFPAAAGFIFDKTGRYEYVFAFSGSMLILASVMTILIPIIRAAKERKLSREDNP